jgi:hypothetical protein
MRRVETPAADSLSGAWIRPNFYLYAQYGATGRLWPVTPESTQLGPGISVPVSGLNECSKIPALMTMIESGGRVFVYEPFGFKIDRLKECGQPVIGGIYALDPSSGNLIGHLSPSLYFMRWWPALGAASCTASMCEAQSG